VIWQNLIFGVAFILLTIVAILCGWVNPMLAAVLHTGSSAVVIFNSARMVRFGEEFAAHVPTPRTVQATPGRVALQPVAT